jgi:hypothetical protein
MIALAPLLLALPAAALQNDPGKDRPLPKVAPGTANPAGAAGSPERNGHEEVNWKSVPELIIAGHAVMRLRARAGGLTPLERAYSLRQRLGPILTLPNLSAEDVEVVQNKPGQTAFIYVRRRLLVTVDRNLAEANSTSVEGLAAIWARNLRTALPQVNVTVRMSDDLPAPYPKITPAPKSPKSPAVHPKRG